MTFKNIQMTSWFALSFTYTYNPSSVYCTKRYTCTYVQHYSWNVRFWNLGSWQLWLIYLWHKLEHYFNVCLVINSTKNNRKKTKLTPIIFHRMTQGYFVCKMSFRTWKRQTKWSICKFCQPSPSEIPFPWVPFVQMFPFIEIHVSHAVGSWTELP